MSESSATPEITALRPLQDALNELIDCSELDHLVESLFDELDRMRQEVGSSLRELEEERHEKAETAEQLAMQSQQFDEMSRRLQEQCAAVDDARQEIERLQQQNQELLQGPVVVVESLRSELDYARRELENLKSQLSDSQELDPAHVQELNVELTAAREQLTRLQSGDSPASIEQLQEVANERDALENELEMVRARAMELQETVSDQKQEMAEQKRELHGELRQLRQLVEKQADMLATPSPSSAAPPPAATDSSSASSVGLSQKVKRTKKKSRPQDPVVDSVMAQFAKLQKDVASRRKPSR